MNCEYCGTEISENSAFCPACGAKTGKPDSPVQPSAPKKPKKKKVWLVAVICVLALAAIAFVAVNILNGTAKNLAMKLTKDDAGYMAYLNKRDAGLLIDALDAAFDTEDKEKTVTEKITASLTDDGYDFVNKLVDEDIDLSWLDSVSLDITSVIDGKKNGVSASLLLNGKNVTSADICIDNENERAYFTAKDIIDKDILLTADVVSEIMGYPRSFGWIDIYFRGISSFASSLVDNMYGIASGPRTILSMVQTSEHKAELTELLREYIDLALDNIKNVDKDDKEVSVGDVSVDCTEYTAEIDGKTIYNIAKVLIKKAQKDEKLKDIIRDFCVTYTETLAKYDAGDVDPDEMLDEFYDMLDELEEDVNDLKDDLDNFDDTYSITYSVCVTNSGEIAERSFRISERFRARYYDGEEWVYEDDYSTEGTIISLKTPRDGSSFALDFEVTDTYNGEKYEVVRMKGDGKASGSKLIGEFKFSVDDEKVFDIEIEDVNFAKLTDKELSGRITLTPGQELAADIFDELFDIYYYEQYIEKPRIVIELAGGTDDRTVKATLCDGKDDLISLEINSSKTEKSSVKVPENAVHADLINESDFNFGNIIEKLKSAGMPEKIIDELS